jgi:adhesin/invasin
LLRRRVLQLICALAAGLIACKDNSSFLVAPTGSVIQLNLNPAEVPVGGETAVITALLLEADGAPAEENTVIVFTTTRGGLCKMEDPCTMETGKGSLTVMAESGVAAVRFVSASTAGKATIQARSGSATPASDTIDQTNRVAPAGTTGVLQVVGPDTLPGGVAARLLGYWYLDTGAPVADGTRFVFQSDSVTVAPRIVVTAGGFAETVITPPAKPGKWMVFVSSGAYRDTITVVTK